MNPLTLYTMKPSGAIIQELSLQGLITPVRGARPYFVLSPLDNGDRMLIHEETVLIFCVSKEEFLFHFPTFYCSFSY